MNHLYFYMLFAQVQSANWGRAVGVKQLMDETSYSRSQIYRYLNTLIKANFVHKPKRGKYYLTDCIGAQSIGFAVLNTMDMIEYSTRKNEGLLNV